MAVDLKAVEENSMSRRDVLRRAAAVLGVSAISPAVAAAALRGLSASTTANPRFLSERQLETVATLAEMILPTTDTPGARAAGVHLYIDGLLADCFSDEHCKSFMAGLAGIDAAAEEAGAPSFLDADDTTRLEIMTEMDQQPGGTLSMWDRLAGDLSQPFFYELKELTIVGYYTSKIGASVELAYDPIPGQYSGCVPYETLGRAWST